MSVVVIILEGSLAIMISSLGLALTIFALRYARATKDERVLIATAPEPDMTNVFSFRRHKDAA